MTKEEYYSIADKKKLPRRCPLLGKCERHILTTAYLTEIYKYGEGKSILERLKNDGYFSDTKESDVIGQKSSPFRFSHSELLLNYYNACPEVSLFDSSIFSLIPQKPIIDGSWDKLHEMNQFGKDGKFKVFKEGHYTECSEYAMSNYPLINRQPNLIKPNLFIYLMKNFQNGYYKIGKSNNPEYREKTLQSQEPVVKLLEVWIAPSTIEKELHKTFDDKRLRGEWFELNEADYEKILEIMKDYPKE